ncbi:peptide-methionine (S)-S-oxide reductase MsrA [Candidatus Gracilibacteria bacterium]|nr:peptide-methionine (S)-S-oxide reductase MsrA [Candidatus Gracilibacteria bacterium]
MIDSIVLGGGCFWCIEAYFQQVPGIINVLSGYTGGLSANPTYREVTGGETGHVEVIKATFDDKIISLVEIFEIFFEMIDPTTLNKQGNDVGTQYRSAIFVNNDTQRKTAEKIIDSIKENYNDPIVTEVEDLDVFYEAENYHQNYYNDNKAAPYCRLVISPKMEKLQKILKKD